MGTNILNRRFGVAGSAAYARPYDVYLPPSYRCDQPAAVVLALHGGGGNKEQFFEMSCPGGDLNSELCFSSAAARHNMVAVYVNGTFASALVSAVRTWNAGGGDAGYTCVSANACAAGVDEATFFRALLNDLNTVVNVDPHRVYATGMSNGGAMSHRIACELSGVFAAVAPVGSGNQYSAVTACSPSRPVPVLQIHGTLDPCWPIAGGMGGCVEDGVMYSVLDSLEGTAQQPGWARRNGCQLPASTTDLADVAADGTTVTHLVYTGCQDSAGVELYRVNQGGHRWPQGHARPPTGGNDLGLLSQDINANDVILGFFAAHGCPSCAF